MWGLTAKFDPGWEGRIRCCRQWTGGDGKGLRCGGFCLVAAIDKDRVGGTWCSAKETDGRTRYRENSSLGRGGRLPSVTATVTGLTFFLRSERRAPSLDADRGGLDGLESGGVGWVGGGDGWAGASGEEAVAEAEGGELDEGGEEGSESDAAEKWGEGEEDGGDGAGETGSDGGDGGDDGDVPEIDAVGVDADVGDEAVEGGAGFGVGAGVGAVEEHEEGDAEEVGGGPADGGGPERVRLEAEEEEGGGGDGEPDGGEALGAAEGAGGEVEDDGEDDAEDDAVDAGVGAVPDLVAVQREVKAKERDAEGDGAEEHKEGAHAEAEAGGDDEGEGKEEVGVLFDGEGPGVRDAADVVLDIEEVAEQAAKCMVPGEQGDGEKDVVLWPDFEAAADKEAAGVDAAGLAPFAHKEAADEESGEDKEDVDAGPTEVGEAEEVEGEGEPVDGGVEVEDEEDGEAAEEVELDFTAGGGGCGRVGGVRVRGRGGIDWDVHLAPPSCGADCVVVLSAGDVGSRRVWGRDRACTRLHGHFSGRELMWRGKM